MRQAVFAALFLTLSAGLPSRGNGQRPFGKQVSFIPRNPADPIAESVSNVTAQTEGAEGQVAAGSTERCDRRSRGSAAIVRVRLASSEVMARVLSDNPGEVMPPAKLESGSRTGGSLAPRLDR